MAVAVALLGRLAVLEPQDKVILVVLGLTREHILRVAAAVQALLVERLHQLLVLAALDCQIQLQESLSIMQAVAVVQQIQAVVEPVEREVVERVVAAERLFLAQPILAVAVAVQAMALTLLVQVGQVLLLFLTLHQPNVARAVLFHHTAQAQH